MLRHLIHYPELPDEAAVGFISATEQMLTEHFDFPELGPPATVTSELFRWDQPISIRDSYHGAIGGRSGFWHPARTLTTNSAGQDGQDFNRQGDETDDTEDWWE